MNLIGYITVVYLLIVSGSVFFVEFDTLDLEIFVICWIESVGSTDDLCLTNQIYLFIVMSQYTNSQRGVNRDM